MILVVRPSVLHFNDRVLTIDVLLLDFCLWAPPQPNSTIANTEAEEVAWCTKKGHGTRLMLNGTLQAVQVLNAPDYLMVVGVIDQPKLNIQEGDYGGECDYGGADLVSLHDCCCRPSVE